MMIAIVIVMFSNEIQRKRYHNFTEIWKYIRIMKLIKYVVYGIHEWNLKLHDDFIVVYDLV